MLSTTKLPALGRVTASPSWQVVDFISDLHLSDQTPRGFSAWSAYMHNTCADAVFILGDLFEAWPGDDSRHEGFEARCAEVLSQSAVKRKVFFMVGNRDFLVGPEFLSACNTTPVVDPTVVSAFDQRILISHGDSLCFSDTAYQKFRTMVRNPAWQSAVLSQPLSARRELASQMRAESERLQATAQPDLPMHDLDLPTCQKWMHAAEAQVFIHGHTHRPADQALNTQNMRHVLSDWSLDVANPPRAEVLRWTQSGLRRISPEDAARKG